MQNQEHIKTTMELLPRAGYEEEKQEIKILEIISTGKLNALRSQFSLRG